ncbi:QsdR family transcriptional regulator [Microbacterium sp. G2-8]|uniref:QsdR family transcriptional regulator n=1 Tax=Microbacterium sp. G2-8 TaxID=2842454 RepID=UPI001C89FE7F|nr:QsdR family transcriptional regulator [Microbacterium sp. G2-8]
MSTIATVGLEAVPTALSQKLSSREHPDAQRAFERARETFVDGRRIDMGALSASLGVDRTSLFRWVGNRDALLGEVLWSLAIPTLVQAEGVAGEGPGPEALAELFGAFAADLIEAPYFRAFLQREPARALRLLTTTEGAIQRRYVATAEWLIATRLGGVAVGQLEPHALAYLLVRVSESFTYSDLIAGESPSIDRARAAFRHVLRVD